MELWLRSDRGVRDLLTVVLNVNFRPANVVPHGLCPLVGFLADDNLFLDARFLTHDRLFLPGLYVDGAVAEGVPGCGTYRTVNGSAFDRHALLPQRHTLLHGLLDRVDAHPHAALFNNPFADFELLLINGDNLFLRPFGAT